MGEDRNRSRVRDMDDDDDWFASFSKETGKNPGKTVSAFTEELKKRLQQQLIDGMFKYAEQKYGRKRQQKEVAKTSAKDDYEVYLKQLNVRVKQANDRLQKVVREKKEIDKKMEAAQKEHDEISNTLSNAESEKQKATEEDRDPVLPADFVVPQRSRRLQANLGALVMKASTQDWGAALQDFISNRKTTTSKAPEWTIKRDKTAAILKAGR